MDITVNLDDALTLWIAQKIGTAQGTAIAAANAEFAVLANLLLAAGVIDREELVAEMTRQIDHINDQSVTKGLEHLRDQYQAAERPLFTVIDGDKQD